MPELLLVNPRAKRRRRKMTARQRQFFGPSRSRRSRSASPRRHRRRRSVAVARRRSPIRRRRYRARRNPRLGSASLSLRSLTSGSFIKQTLVPAAIGAVGAIGIDALWAMLPVPANLKTGALALPAKLIGALLLGAVGSRFVGRRTAELAVASLVTVNLYSMAKSFAAAQFPGVNLGEYPSLSYVQAGPFIPDASGSGMGTYISGAGDATSWDQNIYGDETF